VLETKTLWIENSKQSCFLYAYNFSLSLSLNFELIAGGEVQR
jgi:hypothetical protein